MAGWSLTIPEGTLSNLAIISFLFTAKKKIKIPTHACIFFHKCTYFMTSIEFVFFNSTITSQKINIVLDYPISKGLMALPVQNRYGADDRQEVEDEVQGLRQRRVETSVSSPSANTKTWKF